MEIANQLHILKACYKYGGAAGGDNITLNMFKTEMEDKLEIARRKGRYGWQEMDIDMLEIMLQKHIKKGDMRDVANIAMFIHYRKMMEAE